MTQEEKQLLLKDLCARFPHGVKVWRHGAHYVISCIDIEKQRVYLKVDFEATRGWWFDIEEVKLYLRPMSSMTYEEMQEAREKFFDGSDHYDIDNIGEIYADTYQPYTTVYTLSFARLSGYIDWLNSHHFDYRGLIGKGLAIEVTEENNPYKN